MMGRVNRYFVQARGLLNSQMDAQAQQAHRDFVDGLLGANRWCRLAVHDIKIRYRRTVLGPIWIAVAFSATFTMMAMLFSAVLKADIREFLPYLGAGMVTWSFVSGVASEAPEIFIGAKSIIDGIRFPMTTHILRVVMRHLLLFFHNLAALLLIILVVSGMPGLWFFSLFLMLPILFLALFFGGLILAIIGTRYRDMVQAINVMLQMLFFMTPIIWRPGDIPHGRKYWVDFNPFYHFLEILRSPIMGEAPPLISVVASSLTAAGLGLVAYGVYRVMRRRIPYWL